MIPEGSGSVEAEGGLGTGRGRGRSERHGDGRGKGRPGHTVPWTSREGESFMEPEGSFLTV